MYLSHGKFCHMFIFDLQPLSRSRDQLEKALKECRPLSEGQWHTTGIETEKERFCGFVV